MEKDEPRDQLSTGSAEEYYEVSAVTNRYIKHAAIIALTISAIIAFLLIGTLALSDTGLTVSGAKLVKTASPGDTFTHQITVSISSTSQPVDITLQISSMVQSLDGTPRPGQDDGPYSANDFITLDMDSFHLDPGGKQVVKATIRIPKDVGDGGRYALITVATRPPADRKLSVITAVDVPIYITIKDSILTYQGAIINLSANVSGSQAIGMTTIFENTGNHDFKVRNTVTFSDSQGQTLAITDTDISLWPLIPGMSREIKANLYPDIEILPGLYRISSQVNLDDGTILAQGGTDFALATTLSPVPLSARTQPAKALPTAIPPSNSALVVDKGVTGNWILVITIIAVFVIGFVVAYLAFTKSRRKNRLID